MVFLMSIMELVYIPLLSLLNIYLSVFLLDYPEEILDQRKIIPIVDDCANVEYWVVWKDGNDVVEWTSTGSKATQRLKYIPGNSKEFLGLFYA